MEKKKHHKGHSEGMRSATMPKHHFEHGQGSGSKECNIKYASEFGNPHDLDRASEGLANFARKKHMKY